MKSRLIYIFKIIRSWFCIHDWDAVDGKPCPFTDEDDNHLAVYTCTKCGRNKLVTFYKK